MCSDPNIPEPWKTYCLTNYCLSKDGMGKCDVLMKAYCDTDKGKLDKACSCINSPMAKTKYNPFCEDSNCITAGYPTQGMLTSLGTGCNIVDCSTALTLVNNGGIQLSDPTVTQRCGPGATTEATTSRQGLAGTWDKIKNANTMTKGIMVAALIAAVAVAVYMYRKK